MRCDRVRISKRIVDQATPGDRELFIRDSELRGFGVRVTPGGVKSYFLEFRMGGRRAPKGRIVIGKHGTWTPELARQRAQEWLLDVKRGVNPILRKRETDWIAVDLAFSRYADFFVATYAKRERPRSWQEAERLLRVDLKPFFGMRPLPSLTRQELTSALAQLADRAPGNARYGYSVLRRLFSWAVERGDIESSPMESMPSPVRIPSRDRVLSDKELGAVLRAASREEWPFGPIILLLVSTGQRRSEVIGMRWSEIDVAMRTWSLPAERAKNGLAHSVPLNVIALEVLEELRTQASCSGLIFSTTGRTPVSGISKMKARFDQRVRAALQADLARAGGLPAEMEPWRLHDLRRTVATGLQRLNVRFEVTEAILNHVGSSRSGVAGVYQRHNWSEEKRDALERWGNFAATLKGGSTPSGSARQNI